MGILLVLLWIMYGILPRVITFFNLDNFLTRLFTKLFLYMIIISTIFVIFVILVTFLGSVYKEIKLPKPSINKTQHKEISITEKLSSLKKLKESGVLTNEEFKKKRKKILDEF